MRYAENDITIAKKHPTRTATPIQPGIDLNAVWDRKSGMILLLIL